MSRKYKMVFVKASDVLGNYDGAEAGDYLINIPSAYKRYGAKGCLLFLDRLEQVIRDHAGESPLLPLPENYRHTSEGWGCEEGKYFFTFEPDQKDLPACMSFIQKCADEII